MEIIKEYQFIISTLIIILGWFINNELNRRHEITKKRLNYRLEMLHSFLPVFISMSSSLNPFKEDKNLNKKIIEARINFQLYGLKDEIDLFHKLIDSIEINNIPDTNIHFKRLTELVRERLRQELKIPNASLY
ncbi:hypothetical protein [Arcobacter sp. LA11]|uniref:hypothetical protein n=1 Tax=Arcobacter sp. LA11 TaxID=1898176 RepID=UPI000932D2C0|nr:hypothetical protein [Arcobacter sp. LA11]